MYVTYEFYVYDVLKINDLKTSLKIYLNISFFNFCFNLF